VPHRYPAIVVVVFSLLTVLLQRSLNALNELSAIGISSQSSFAKEAITENELWCFGREVADAVIGGLRAEECWSGQWRIERTTAAFVAFQCAQKATLMHITLDN
jgi:hypothetical protein